MFTWPDLVSSPTTTLLLLFFADDIAAIANSELITNWSYREILQQALNWMPTWTKHWCIKLNQMKSTNPRKRIHVYLNGILITQCASNIRVLQQMYWIVIGNSETIVESTFRIYKSVIKSTWTCGIQLWCYTNSSNREIAQRSRNEFLQCTTNVCRYTPNVINNSQRSPCKKNFAIIWGATP